MLDFYKAFDQLLAQVSQRQTEVIEMPLADCFGHYLAHEVQVEYDSPQFDNSAMDGYALSLHDSDTYTIVARIAAGDKASPVQLQPGQACRIFTGAPTPAGCDTVIMQEHTEVSGTELRCLKPIKADQNIRRQAEDLKRGDMLLPKGMYINAGVIGLAASQGYTQLPVHRKLRVSVFSSGNELVDATKLEGRLPEGHIFDSNRYQTVALLKNLACEVVEQGCLPDNLEITKARLQEAASKSDLIITSGGVSVGEEDHLKNALEQLGQLTHWKLLLKPGKPFAWGEIGNTYVMMLPGNPVASFVTFSVLVKPAIQRILGREDLGGAVQTLGALVAKTTFARNKPQERREFLRAHMGLDEQGELVVTIMARQGSHMLSAAAAANCLVEFEPETTIAVGDKVSVYPLS